MGFSLCSITKVRNHVIYEPKPYSPMLRYRPTLLYAS